MGDLKVKGFCDLSQTSMSLNESTFLFLLTAITVDWDYYHLGKRHGITGNKGVNISMTIPANGTYYVYIDSEDGSLRSSITKWSEKDTKIPVCEIQWTNENNPKYVITDKRLLVSDSIGGSSITPCSQADMETAMPTENTKATTPLRAFQGFIYWCLHYIFPGLTTTDKTLVGAINEVDSKVKKSNSVGARLYLYYNF